MKLHEEKLLEDAIKTAIKNEVKVRRLKIWLAVYNIILVILLVEVMLLWIGH